MALTQTGSYQLNFAASPGQEVQVYSSAYISVGAATPGQVAKLVLSQMSPGGSVITFLTGFSFVDNDPPVLGTNAGSSVVVWFACSSSGYLDELRREVVNT